MAIYKCRVCETVYDEEKEDKTWDKLPDDSSPRIRLGPSDCIMTKKRCIT